MQRTIEILEQQRQDLVIRVLKKHEEMEATRIFTERILAGLSEFFLLLDKDFQVIQANREFLEHTGYPPLEESPLSLDQLVEPGQAATIRQMLTQEDFSEMEAHFGPGRATVCRSRCAVPPTSPRTAGPCTC